MIRDLLWIADHRNARTRTNFRDTSPQVRSHLAAHGLGQFFLPLVGHRLCHHRLDLRQPGRICAGDQRIGRSPGFFFGFSADDLQPHGELNFLASTVLRCALTHLLDLFGDALRVITPEQVNSRVLGGNLRSLL
ncbi:hypothetical protein D3C79_764160 [compost metagenome]